MTRGDTIALRETAFAMSSSDLPKTHAEFIGRLSALRRRRRAASHDGKDAGISKRQKILADSYKSKNGGPLTAPEARYGLGGDDNLYLQLGLSVLHTASPERTLAPAALYSVDVVHAIREAIAQNAEKELDQRRSNAAQMLDSVLKKLYDVVQNLGLGDILQGTEPFTKSETALKDLYEEAKKNPTRSIFGIEANKKKFLAVLKYFKDVLKSKVVDEIDLHLNHSYEEPGFQDVQEVETDAPVVGYVVSRGLCGHRGPAECETASPTDKLLSYSAPRKIARFLSRCTDLSLPEHTAESSNTDQAAASAIAEAIDAFNGDFAIDDALDASAARNPVRDARQVRWEPKGEHAEALAYAAAYEHAIARCSQLLKDPASTLSDAARAEIVSACMCLKLKQLDSLHELACAAEDGEVLHHMPLDVAVTRPPATIRGTLHLAHDAGHHPAPRSPQFWPRRAGRKSTCAPTPPFARNRQPPGRSIWLHTPTNSATSQSRRRRPHAPHSM